MRARGRARLSWCAALFGGASPAISLHRSIPYPRVHPERLDAQPAGKTQINSRMPAPRRNLRRRQPTPDIPCLPPAIPGGIYSRKIRRVGKKIQSHCARDDARDARFLALGKRGKAKIGSAYVKGALFLISSALSAPRRNSRLIAAARALNSPLLRNSYHLPLLLIISRITRSDNARKG